MADAAKRVPQGSVLDHVLFATNANGLADNLTVDHLLYADDVKLIAPFPPENKRLLSKALLSLFH